MRLQNIIDSIRPAVMSKVEAAMQNMGMNGPTGVAIGLILGGCLHD